MARQSKYQSKAAFEAVIQLPLLPESPTEIKGLASDGEAVSAFLAQILADGYEVTLAYQESRKNFSCCVKGVSPDCTNAGKWMYSNAPDPYTALAVGMYKHFILAREGAWVETTADAETGLS